jgi:hypothetical protein
VMFALAFLWVGSAGGVELTPYLKSPLEGNPRTNAGFELDSGVLCMRADLAVNAQSAVTKTLPQVSSRLALADRIDLVTHLTLPDWSGGVGRSGTGIDTRVHLEPQSVFIDRIEGRIHRDPNGVERHSLKLGFSDTLAQGGMHGPLAIRGKAIIEKTLRPEDEDSLAMGVEAIVTGLPATRLGLDFLAPADASSRLSVSLRRATGAATERERVASFAYGHSWAVQDSTELGLKLEASRVADEIEPALGISWKATF